MDGYRKKIKKKMKTFLEAVIDIPRRTYALKVYLIMLILTILKLKIVLRHRLINRLKSLKKNIQL